jgi:hypothetical protein
MAMNKKELRDANWHLVLALCGAEGKCREQIEKAQECLDRFERQLDAKNNRKK